MSRTKQKTTMKELFDKDFIFCVYNLHESNIVSWIEFLTEFKTIPLPFSTRKKLKETK